MGVHDLLTLRCIDLSLKDKDTFIFVNEHIHNSEGQETGWIESPGLDRINLSKLGCCRNILRNLRLDKQLTHNILSQKALQESSWRPYRPTFNPPAKTCYA